MFRRICAMLLVLACLTPAFASALTVGENLSGTYCWPEGSSEAEAAYVYRYCYPTVSGDDALADMINNQYTYLVDDAMAFFVPMTVSELDTGANKSSTVITHEITCLNESSMSVLITTTHNFGGVSRTVLSAHNYTLTGSMAGSGTNLPRLLGLLDDSETDEWLLQRQTDKADKIVRKLIWRAISNGTHNDGVVFFDTLVEEDLEWLIYPEEDFYLNQDGQPVFFFQPGTVADESYGPVFFTITLEMIDDEM